MNNRIKTAVLLLSNGTKLKIRFKDSAAEQTFMLPAPVTCTWVKLIVKSIYRGTKWNDLAVSELHPLAKCRPLYGFAPPKVAAAAANISFHEAFQSFQLCPALGTRRNLAMMGRLATALRRAWSWFGRTDVSLLPWTM